MKKPASLRHALTAALPEYQSQPDNLRLFVDKGRLVSRATPGLGYEWRYTLRLEFEDCTSSPDAIAIPLLLWLRQHQPERLLEFAREDTALGFSADIIDDRTWDLAWAFELAEAVVLAPRPGGGWDVTYVGEPQLDDATMLDDELPADTLIGQIWLGEQLLATR